MRINKKIITVILLIIMLVTLFTGYNSVESKVDKKTSSMFIILEQTIHWNVVYHTDTKVMYAVSQGSSNHGTFTLLVNPDGTPMLYEGE